MHGSCHTVSGYPYKDLHQQISREVFSVALLENTNWCSISSKNNEVYEKRFLHLKQTALLRFHLLSQALHKTWLIHKTFTITAFTQGPCLLLSSGSSWKEWHLYKPSSVLPWYFLSSHPLLFQQIYFVQNYFVYFVWGFLLYFSNTGAYSVQGAEQVVTYGTGAPGAPTCFMTI